LFSACLGRLSSVDIDLIYVLTYISENCDKIGTNFQYPTRNSEDYILTPIACTKHTHAKRRKQWGMVG
jgi:hypothetical protein